MVTKGTRQKKSVENYTLFQKKQVMFKMHLKPFYTFACLRGGQTLLWNFPHYYFYFLRVPYYP